MYQLYLYFRFLVHSHIFPYKIVIHITLILFNFSLYPYINIILYMNSMYSIEGNVLSWGSGQNGKLGHGTEENISVPTLIPALQGVCIVRIAAGSEHSAALTAANEVYTWGHGDGGRLGHGDNSQCLVPTPVHALKSMNALPVGFHCGDKFTIAILETIDSEPSSKVSQTGGSESVISTRPPQVEGLASLMDELENSSLGEQWVHKQIDRLIANSLLTEDIAIPPPSSSSSSSSSSSFPTSSKRLTRQQLGYALLSLMSRASSTNYPLSEVKMDSHHYHHLHPGKDVEYCIECCPETFNYLSSLLQWHVESFCDHQARIYMEEAESTIHSEEKARCEMDRKDDDKEEVIMVSSSISSSSPLRTDALDDPKLSSSPAIHTSLLSQSLDTLLPTPGNADGQDVINHTQSQFKQQHLQLESDAAVDSSSSYMFAPDSWSSSFLPSHLSDLAPLYSILAITSANLDSLIGQYKSYKVYKARQKKREEERERAKESGEYDKDKDKHKDKDKEATGKPSDELNNLVASEEDKGEMEGRLEGVRYFNHANEYESEEEDDGSSDAHSEAHSSSHNDDADEDELGKRDIYFISCF